MPHSAWRDFQVQTAPPYLWTWYNLNSTGLTLIATNSTPTFETPVSDLFAVYLGVFFVHSLLHNLNLARVNLHTAYMQMAGVKT